MIPEGELDRSICFDNPCSIRIIFQSVCRKTSHGRTEIAAEIRGRGRQFSGQKLHGKFAGTASELKDVLRLRETGVSYQIIEGGLLIESLGILFLAEFIVIRTGLRSGESRLLMRQGIILRVVLVSCNLPFRSQYLFPERCPPKESEIDFHPVNLHTMKNSVEYPR